MLGVAGVLTMAGGLLAGHGVTVVVGFILLMLSAAWFGMAF